MCRIYRYKSYAQINTMLLAEASLLIVRNPTPSQVSLLLIFLWHNLHSPCKEQRTCLHSLASEALGEQAGHLTIQKQPPSLISYHHS